MKLGILLGVVLIMACGGFFWWAASSQKTAQNAAIANTARYELTMARSNAAMGKEVDRERLAKTPGIEGALREAAEDVKRSVALQLRDPTDPLWGDIWTTDYITICGSVNGRNAYGAYAGDEMFYAPDGMIGRLPGHPAYRAKDLQMCFGGGHRVILSRQPPLAK